MFPLTLWTNLVIDFFGTYYLHIVCVLKQSFIFFLKIRLAFVNHIHTAELGFGTKRCWNGAVVPRWCWDGAVVPRWCRDGAVVLRVPNLPFPPWDTLSICWVSTRLIRSNNMTFNGYEIVQYIGRLPRSISPGRKRPYTSHSRRKTTAVYSDRLPQSHTTFYGILRLSSTMTANVRRLRVP